LKKKNYKQLNQLIDEEYNEIKDSIDLHNCDANDFIRRKLHQTNWKKNRGVLFLDPFALSVNWESLSIIAKTKAIDVWYLFPIGALNRMLTTNGKMDITWEKKLNTVLGTDQWKDAFYKEKSREAVQLSFGENGETNTGDPYDESNLFKSTNIANIKDFITKRLEETFAWVSPNPRLLLTEKKTPLFYLFLAVSNPSKPAIDLAKKLAKYTLDKNKNG
jgi:three-Cys-motif partner protein